MGQGQSTHKPLYEYDYDKVNELLAKSEVFRKREEAFVKGTYSSDEENNFKWIQERTKTGDMTTYWVKYRPPAELYVVIKKADWPSKDGKHYYYIGSYQTNTAERIEAENLD